MFRIGHFLETFQALHAGDHIESFFHVSFSFDMLRDTSDFIYYSVAKFSLFCGILKPFDADHLIRRTILTF
jgi:hypothetical protein